MVSKMNEIGPKMSSKLELVTKFCHIYHSFDKAKTLRKLLSHKLPLSRKPLSHISQFQLFDPNIWKLLPHISQLN